MTGASGCSSSSGDKGPFPSKPIKIVVYTGPGGLIDRTARKFTEVAAKYTDATFVVENKPGAGGIVAMRSVMQSPADGYTLYACTKSNISKIVSTGGDAYIDALDWLAMIMADPECIITLADTPLADWNAVVEDAREKKGEQVWLGPAMGGLDHVMAIRTWERFDMSAVWIPFKSGGNAKAALLSGQGVAYVGNPQDALGNDNLKVAVVSGKSRVAQFSDAPTFAEFGVDGLDDEFMWRGFAVRQGCPPEVLSWYDSLFRQVNDDEQWREFWEKRGIDVNYKGSEEFTAMVRRDRDQFAHYLRQIGIIQAGQQSFLANWLQGIGLWLSLGFLLLANGIVIAGLQWKTGRGAGRYAIPAALISLGVLFFLLSLIFPKSDGVGPAAVPQMWIALMVPLCVCLCFWESRRLAAAEGPAKADADASIRPLASLLALYLIAIPLLGYFASSFVFLCVAMRWLGVRRIEIQVFVSLGWLLFSYFVFVRLLYVPLPVGVWRNWLS